MLKIVSKKLEKTNLKASKAWRQYRQTKKHILGRKTISKEEKKQLWTSEIDLTRQKISGHYLQYREYKFSTTNKSEYSDFNFTKKFNTLHTTQKIYRAKKNFDTDKLDDIVEKAIYSDPKITGILVVFEVENEQGLKSYVSNYITKDLLSKIQEVAELKDLEYGEGVIFDFVTDRITAGYKESLKLKFIYMRIIYENAKSGKK